MAQFLNWLSQRPAGTLPDDRAAHLKLITDAVVPDWVSLETLLDRLERRDGAA